MKNPKVFIFTNIISPYRTFLFNALYELNEIDLKVVYIAETEKIREWRVDKDLEFPHEIIFKGKLDNIHFSVLVFKTWRKLNQFNPDIIIIPGYNYFTCWIILLWAKIKNKKVILWSASSREDKPRGFIKENIKKILVSRCNAACVTGTKSKDYLMELGLPRDKTFIVGNVTNNNFYYEKTKRFRDKKKFLRKEMNILPHNFLYIGRFSPEKNLFFLLKCFKNALKSKAINDWGLILVGDGPQKKEIESFIKDNNIKNVFLPGFVQMEEIPKYLSLSDILILSSISETWGLVVNEAMAAGLPVLVSRKCGCYPDLVREGINGFSFDPHNVDELSNLLKKISQKQFNLSDMGEESLKIVNKYTPENAANAVLNVIKNVTRLEK